MNCLNKSASKLTYSFSKSPRKSLAQKAYVDTYYDLPSSVKATEYDRKRTPSFGIGARTMNKSLSKAQDEMPPPGHYRVKTAFEVNKD